MPYKKMKGGFLKLRLIPIKASTMKRELAKGNSLGKK